MSIKKLDTSFLEETGHRLSNTSQLKMFNLLIDTETNEKFMNIFRSYLIYDSVQSKTSYFDTYEVGHDDWWDNISYVYYQTPNLWWVVAMINGITNPFEELEEGTNIKILKGSYVMQLLNEVKEISEL